MDSPLISPTKARQAAIQAKDWAYVNSWLSRKYSPHNVPPFERNDETLRSLLAIAAANDAADEEASLVHRAREEVVRALKQREEAGDSRKQNLLEDIEARLDLEGKEALNDLAETIVLLGDSSTDVTELAHAIIELTRDEFELANQVQKVEALQAYLDKEILLVQTEIETFKSHPAYETPPDLTSQTVEWARSAKLLGAKINEYRDKTTSLQRSVSIDGPTIEEVVQEEGNLHRLKETVRVLENRIKSYRDLPPDLEDAKNEYKRLEKELNRLTRERDQLFENAITRKK
jgi:HAUS augmin-like complex subunit 1